MNEAFRRLAVGHLATWRGTGRVLYFRGPTRAALLSLRHLGGYGAPFSRGKTEFPLWFRPGDSTVLPKPLWVSP